MTRRSDRRQTERASAYKLCSLALQYPDDEIIAGRSAARRGRRPAAERTRRRLTIAIL